MDSIFFEKQEGSLCAQHCLNALLQGPYFSAVDLSELARQLDESERQAMAEQGTGTDAYRHFLEQPSGNYDDSGFFSVQVIQKALGIWGITLVPYSSRQEVAQVAQADPLSQQAYICNLREHWFCLRKLGTQWFNLNSLLKAPELVSDTYLQIFLHQLQTEGYSIFIVLGELPPCEAEQVLRLTPAVPQPKAPRTRTQQAKDVEDDPEMVSALEESRKLAEPDDDAAIQRALQLSMQGLPAGYTVPTFSSAPSTSSSSSHPAPPAASAEAPSQAPEVTPDAEEIRRRRLRFLDKKQEEQTPKTPQKKETPQQKPASSSEEPGDPTEPEDPELAAAIKLSMGPNH